MSMSMLTLFLIPLFFKTPSADRVPSFSFESFSNDSGIDIRLSGDAKIAADANSSLRLTRAVSSSAGRAVYEKPVRLVDGKKLSKRKVSFSTHFSFSISPEGGDGLAFSLLPADFPVDAFDGGEFGLSPGIRESKFKVFAVELDALRGARGGDANGTGNTILSVKLRNVSSLNWVPVSGERLHCWIDYEAGSNQLEVRLRRSGDGRPDDPLLSYYPIDLSEKWKEEEVLVALSSSNRNSSQTCSVYSWSFKPRVAPHWLHSQPFLPGAVSESANHVLCERRRVCLLRFLAALIFGAGCGALVALFVLFARSVLRERGRPVVPEEFAACPKVFEYEKIVVAGDGHCKAAVNTGGNGEKPPEEGVV